MASFRWYRSSINRYDEPPEAAGVAAVPAELFLEGEIQGERAAAFLRDHDDVIAAGVRAKRTADLRASWSEPADGAARFMFEDGKLPVRFGPVDHQEVAAQKFFTIDGDASVPLLFSSRLFRVWARATLTRSRRLIERLSPGSNDHVRIWSAGGSSSVPGTLRNLRDAGHENLAVLLDRDDASRRLIDEVRMLVEEHGGHVVLISPNMEDWLETWCPTDYALAMPATGVRAKAMRRFSGHASLRQVLRSNEDFASWVADALGVTLENLPSS